MNYVSNDDLYHGWQQRVRTTHLPSSHPHTRCTQYTVHRCAQTLHPYIVRRATRRTHCPITTLPHPPTFPPPVHGLKHVHAPRARGTSHCTLMTHSFILSLTTHVSLSPSTCHPRSPTRATYPSSRRPPPHPQPYNSVLELDFAINRDGLVDPVHEVRLRVNTNVSV